MSPVMSGTTDVERALMRRALELAARGHGRVAPNPLVGCVIAHGDEIVGEGWHTEFGAPHAEVEALRVAGDRARGATVYITLEPCNAHGKTPPCTEALIAAGAARVVYAVPDPNPQMQGGAARLRAAGVLVDSGVEAAAARDLNAIFLNRFTSERPFVTLKLALSLDDALAAAPGERTQLTGALAQAEVHHQRAGHDAILVGVGTVLVDDPHLTVRGVTPPPRRAPMRVILDRTGRTPVHATVVRTANDTPTCILGASISVRRRRAFQELGVHVVTASTLIEQLRALRRELAIESVYVEGGAAVAGAFLEADGVDRLIVVRAPVSLGSRSLRLAPATSQQLSAALARWRRVEERALGPDRMAVLIPPPD
jgi:diaminohydroxyphosphoribosylaminopyrimidine deaminase / 5-amino-6-(5-phosphoribosylamino)uracil reductase